MPAIAREARSQLLGPDHPDTLASKEHLAMTHSALAEAAVKSGGRLMRMYRRSATILVLAITMAVLPAGCSLVGQLTPSARYDSPSGRVDLPESGIAVAFPDDWSTVDDVVAGYGREFAADRRWVGLKTRVVDLPAGRAGHIMRAVDSESESASSWFFTNADAWFLLECVNHTALGKDWLPIAETFEFL